MYIGRYNYKELREAAESGRAEDLNALRKWFELYGRDYWNGEYYDADGLHLYPVYDWDEERDQGELLGYAPCKV